MEQAILQLCNVSKFYINGSNVVPGLTKANIALHRGEFVAITGESGSGKSTLGHILSGIIPYEDGEMLFRGSPTSHYDSVDWENYRKNNISFISQSYGILPGVSVIDHIVSALRLCGYDPKPARERALEILDQVELRDVARRRAAKLSSGQKQRLSIARALAKPCDILIADEPTGNLDTENSNKVIRLLAEASRERLVVIITHEFSEVSDYVTRHIRLQDSVVAGDLALREKAICPPREKREPRKERLAGYVASMQMGSRPAWCAAVLLFFALTAFAVFVLIGSFIVALDDTSARIYDPDLAFANGDKERVVVVRKDGAVMEQADYDVILDIRYVESLERYGYIADMRYYYRENVDYEINVSRRNYGTIIDPVYYSYETVELHNVDQFIQTVPLLPDGQQFIREGREPENFYEVVIAGDASMIGQTMTVYLQDSGSWGDGTYMAFEMTVVGTTDHGEGLYFHDDIGRMMTFQYLNLNLDSGLCCPYPVVEPIYSKVCYRRYYEPRGALFYVECFPDSGAASREILDTEVMVSQTMYIKMIETGLFSVITDVEGGEPLNIAGLNESTYMYAYGVSPALFEAYMQTQPLMEQVSIFIRDYAYLDRVMEALDEAGYRTVSPYVVGANYVDPDLESERMQTLYISLGALIVVILLQMIVLRAMFAMQNSAYQVLSSVGLLYRTAKNSLILQVFLFAVLGQIIGLGAVIFCGAQQVPRIVNVTKYLRTGYWFILSGVHLLLSGMVAMLNIRSLKKQVYAVSVRTDDLMLTEDEEADV